MPKCVFMLKYLMKNIKMQLMNNKSRKKSIFRKKWMKQNEYRNGNHKMRVMYIQ